MVSVISIVNSKYSDPKLNIKCARQDGEMVLETFRQLLKDEYDLCTSGCFENIRSRQLKDILEVLFQSQREGNTVIVYFSCHGELDGSEFHLLMSDAGQEEKEGHFAVSDLQQLCQKFENKFLLIFDCCYSGGALPLANKKDINKESNITVISSSCHWKRAKYDEIGSKFSLSFCEALRRLERLGGEITVSNIVKQIKQMDQKGVECLVNISEGKEDFAILPAGEQVTIYDDKFVKTFIERLDSCVAVREMMWYSINDLPNKVKVKIFEKYFEKGCSEASWLVRRAMGNILSSLDNGSKSQGIVDKFLDSFNWMEKCVGIVGISKSISEKRAQYLKDILLDDHSSIDLIWLADLYLSDSDYHDIQVTLNTKLSKSIWGLIEIWDRYSGKYEKNLFDIISEHVEDKELIDGLSREIDLRENAKKGSLTDFLYKGEKRGRTIELKKKWLLSLLYGNWRGRIECNLKEYFSNNNDSKIIGELEEAKNIPSVERRVSLFEYFENEPKYFEKYKEHIRWGLQDEHPWVRRVAILCFKNYPKEVDKSFEDKIETDIYPETFAMIINAASITLNDYKEYIKGYGWAESENEAILKAVSRENKRKYM